MRNSHPSCVRSVVSMVIMLPKFNLASAELKHRGRVLGKGEKNSFYCFAGQRRPQQANALKTVPPPPIETNCREFYSKKEKNRFSDWNQDRIGTNMHSSFFGGILVIKAGDRRSQPAHDGGLLGYCLE